MCGIAGIASKNGLSLCNDMRQVMASFVHRGPDDGGYLTYSRKCGVSASREWCAPPEPPEVILLHRRLSILDLTPTGWQPMASIDGRYYVVFNGEIYNYLELREELQRVGHRFVTQSDTEVLLASYAEWGLQALNRFVGMFAFALLDTRDRKLLLARDFFGIKPLFYSASPEGLSFASEIRTLLQLCNVPRGADPERLYLYLRYGISDFGDGSLLSAVKQVPAAHYLHISLDEASVPEPVRYWQHSTDVAQDISFDEAAHHLRDLFLNNVRLHLRSDVPLGAALSGGIDSSSIVMAMRHLQPAMEIHGISYIAESAHLGERRWVDLLGKAGGIQLHKVRLDSSELVKDFDAMMMAQNEPFSSTSPLAQYCVFREAGRLGIKVMLDGQGADEFLAGYAPYQSARLASLLRQNRMTEAVRFLQSSVTPWEATKLLLRCSDYLLRPSLQRVLREMAGRDYMPQWLNQSWFSDRGVKPLSLYYSSEQDVLRNALLRDMTRISLPRLLRYEDRNSMAFSIESRVPFLTPDLVNFVLSLPESYIIDDQRGSKAVFREAMRGIVPDAILDRRDKIGFETPEQKWLTQLAPWVENVFALEAARRIPALNIDFAYRHWKAVKSGQKRFDSNVWRMLNLVWWSDQYQVSYA